MLIARVSNTDMTWHKDVLPSPRSYHQLDLTLDDNTVLKAIEHMNFIQMKSTYLLRYAGTITVTKITSTYARSTVESH